jgi:hypothetical protein
MGPEAPITSLPTGPPEFPVGNFQAARPECIFRLDSLHIDYQEKCPMNIQISLQPLLALIAGILILIMPRLLNYIVAIYLIVVGLVGLFGLKL